MYCKNCGSFVSDGQNFCSSCGKAINENNKNGNVQNNVPNQINSNSLSSKVDNIVETNAHSVENSNTITGIPRISKRNLLGAVLFGIITCGLFFLAWFVWIVNDTKKLTNDRWLSTKPIIIFYVSGIIFIFLWPILLLISPIIALLIFISLVVESIYCIFLNYRIGVDLNKAGEMYGKSIQNKSILYLILSIFGLPLFINCCIMQQDLNQFGVNKGE